MIKIFKNTLALYKDLRYLPHEDISFSFLIILSSMIISTLFSIVFGTHLTLVFSVIFAIVHFFISCTLILVYIYSAIRVMCESHESHEEHNVLFPACGLCDKKILTNVKTFMSNNNGK